MKDTILLIGGGGHCKACIDVIEQEGKYTIAGIVDLADKKGQSVLGYPLVGSDDDLPELIKSHPNVQITLGQIKSPERRIALFNKLLKLGAKFPVLRSPLAYISTHAEVGEGSIVMHHALINAGARVGRNCIINTKSLIEHDAVVEDFCHISTGAIINGGVRVGPGTFFGSNAVSKEYVTIRENTVVGCGAQVIRNIQHR